MSRRTLFRLALLVAVFALSVSLQSLAAFSEPSSAPPAGNAYAPLTTSPNAETKSGMLTVGELGGSGSLSTFGAVTLKGSKNSWSGINFQNVSGSSAGTLMMHPSYSGFYNSSDNGWRLYVTDAGDTYVHDVYLSSAGKWASQMGGGISCVTNSIGSEGTVYCPSGYTMTGGGINGTNNQVDATYPSGNGWYCRGAGAHGCYVRCCK
ncbi:MAG TPA: hypothetical protein VF829_03010 [Candidatus Paceibacterota bacterium]